MQTTPPQTSKGKVCSVYLHPEKGGEPMQPVDAIELVEQMGIRGNSRYFGRRNRTTGLPSVRQVSLMEQEQIDAHAEALGVARIQPGAVRANVETSGIDLIGLIGRQIQVGDATLLICEARTPCAKMDAVCPGLRARMENQRQGVLAQVVKSGCVRIGDAIVPV